MANDNDRREHWERVYTEKQPLETSWFQRDATRSFALFPELRLTPSTRVIDVGGGESALVDALLERGLGEITVLDISAAALARSRARLGDRAANVRWMTADITTTQFAEGAYDVWHDRAVFHFLTSAVDRLAYVTRASRAIAPEGALLIGTFAMEGPERCSGLAVARYAAEDLAAAFAPDFVVDRAVSDVHQTPWGAEQRFTFALLRRRA